MAENEKSIGEIAWVDLTVGDAAPIRDFYADVVGWTTTPVDMGGYNDFCMNASSTGEAVSGVCYARGSNADLPPVWLVYIIVENLDHSIARCLEHGGRIVSDPKDMGASGRYCVVQDPAGATFALFQYAESQA
ncbi:MAG TPA: VOC family protein [Rhodothermales bacterium]